MLSIGRVECGKGDLVMGEGGVSEGGVCPPAWTWRFALGPLSNSFPHRCSDDQNVFVFAQFGDVLFNAPSFSPGWLPYPPSDPRAHLGTTFA